MLSPAAKRSSKTSSGKDQQQDRSLGPCGFSTEGAEAYEKARGR